MKILFFKIQTSTVMSKLYHIVVHSQFPISKKKDKEIYPKVKISSYYAVQFPHKYILFNIYLPKFPKAY